MAKQISLDEFRAIIREEALKFKKRVVLENEKKALEAELKQLNEGMYEEGMYEEELNEENMEEIFGNLFGKKQQLSPEEAQKAGEQIIKSHPGKLKMFKYITQQGGKDMALKFMQYVGMNPDVKYPTWDKAAVAPDGSQGFFKDATVYGYGDTMVGDVAGE